MSLYEQVLATFQFQEKKKMLALHPSEHVHKFDKVTSKYVKIICIHELFIYRKHNSVHTQGRLHFCYILDFLYRLDLLELLDQVDDVYILTSVRVCKVMHILKHRSHPLCCMLLRPFLEEDAHWYFFPKRIKMENFIANTNQLLKRQRILFCHF